MGGHAEHVDLPPVRAAAERGPDAVVEEHPGVGLGQRRQRPEVAVIALPFAGDRRVHRVVEVVAPLRGQAVPARLPGGDQAGVVGVGLGDQDQLAVQPGGDDRDGPRMLVQMGTRPRQIDAAQGGERRPDSGGVRLAGRVGDNCRSDSGLNTSGDG